VGNVTTTWHLRPGSTPKSNTITYDISHNYGTHKIMAHAQDSKGSNAIKRQSLILHSHVVDCAANFDYFVEPVVDHSQFDFSEVTIEYTNEDGEVFRSDFSEQPSISSFIVNSSEVYQKNEKNQKTAKLNVSFSAKLYNADLSKQLDVENVEAIIAVAFP